MSPLPVCSVAVMSDAAHMFSDASSFLISFTAAVMVARPSSHRFSFGYHRIEILGAVLSVMFIWMVTGALVWEAGHRIFNPVKVDGRRK